MARIESGAVVRLESGGPRMAVGAAVSASVLVCCRFDGTELETANFYRDAPVPAENAADGGTPA
jgi:uncharacterized protein YodC (DUF2158 family)